MLLFDMGGLGFVQELALLKFLGTNNFLLALGVVFCFNFVVNLILASILLHFAKGKLTKSVSKKNFVLIILVATFVSFVIESLIEGLIGGVPAPGFLNILLGAVMLYWFLVPLYLVVFRDGFGASLKRAALYGIIFMLLTNPLWLNSLVFSNADGRDLYPSGVSARNAMLNGISKVYQQGGGSVTIKKAQFDAGLVVMPSDIVGENPIVPSNIRFVCADNEFCGGVGDSPIKIDAGTTNKIQVNQKVSGTIVVCKAYSGSNANYYNVCVGASDGPDPQVTANSQATASFCDAKCK
jgi:hypothetical protein